MQPALCISGDASAALFSPSPVAIFVRLINVTVATRERERGGGGNKVYFLDAHQTNTRQMHVGDHFSEKKMRIGIKLTTDKTCASQGSMWDPSRSDRGTTWVMYGYAAGLVDQGKGTRRPDQGLRELLRALSMFCFCAASLFSLSLSSVAFRPRNESIKRSESPCPGAATPSWPALSVRRISDFRINNDGHLFSSFLAFFFPPFFRASDETCRRIPSPRLDCCHRILSLGLGIRVCHPISSLANQGDWDAPMTEKTTTTHLKTIPGAADMK